MKLRVWWIPQIPCKPFYVEVGTVKEGVKLLDTLVKYDQFQLDNNIKPEFCNSGGLQMFDPEQPEEGWSDWIDEDTGEDDPRVWLQTSNQQ
ncbi:hypothetical protein [Endozoicomonas sp. ALC066]|uniref:hypothetical protein n=1 Tax=Endozoicomonas sp. ALC066 TaxID=3403078 RepID=UPI003BB6AB64